MSLVSIRAALETGLDGMTPALATAWENVDFTPTPGTPYQRAYLLPAEPDDIEMSGKKFLERGIFQISLFYSLDEGPAAASTRADLIRGTFYRGASFTSGGVTVDITRTPEIGPAMADDDRYMIPIRVRFSAQISRS